MLFPALGSSFRARIEMIAIFTLTLLAAVQCYPPGQILYSKDLSNSLDEVYGSYLDLPGNKKDEAEAEAEATQEQQPQHPYADAYLDKLLTEEQQRALPESEPESRRVERTAYLHIQTRQKDKRYASYLTLCHFKICNMGRKRTTRYFHVISALDDGT